MIKAGAEVVSNEKQLPNLHPSLQRILMLELARANEVVEVTRSDWPQPNSLFVYLSLPFQRRYGEMKEAQFYALHDPHYWGDEYSVDQGQQILACRYYK